MKGLADLNVLLISLLVMGIIGCGDKVTTVEISVETSEPGQQLSAENPPDLSFQCESGILLHGQIELLGEEGECLSFIPYERNPGLPAPFEILGPLAEEIKGIPDINGARISIIGQYSPLTVVFCSGGGGLVVCSYELDPIEPVDPIIIGPVPPEPIIFEPIPIEPEPPIVIPIPTPSSVPIEPEPPIVIPMPTPSPVPIEPIDSIVIEPICDSEDEVLSTDEIWANGEELVGQMVSVVGMIDWGPEGVFCTMVECPTEDPCCRWCGAVLIVSSSPNSYIYLRGTYEGENVSCDGSNCQIECYPIEPTSVCQVNGELEKQEMPSGRIRFYLDLENFCCFPEIEIPDPNCPPVEPEPPMGTECLFDSDCVRGGCSGETCAPEPMISVCIWLPEFECYQIAPCACISGRCGFIETPEFLACMNAISN